MEANIAVSQESENIGGVDRVVYLTNHGERFYFDGESNQRFYFCKQGKHWVEQNLMSGKRYGWFQCQKHHRESILKAMAAKRAARKVERHTPIVKTVEIALNGWNPAAVQRLIEKRPDLIELYDAEITLENAREALNKAKQKIKA